MNKGSNPEMKSQPARIRLPADAEQTVEGLEQGRFFFAIIASTISIGMTTYPAVHGLYLQIHRRLRTA